MPAPTDRTEFTRLNAEGWTITQLAAHFGINPRSVTRLRRKLGISGRNGNTIAPERLAQIAAMLEDGASQKETARTLGVDREAIRAHFPGSGWTSSQGGTFALATRTLWHAVEAANYADRTDRAA